jgi:hypothetical protein
MSIGEYRALRTDERSEVDGRPGTPAHVLNEGTRRWGHQLVFDQEELSSRLIVAGVVDVARNAWRESEHADLRGLENRPFHGDLIVEATR